MTYFHSHLPIFHGPQIPHAYQLHTHVRIIVSVIVQCITVVHYMHKPLLTAALFSKAKKSAPSSVPKQYQHVI